jgi:hypothetical protein
MLLNTLEDTSSSNIVSADNGAGGTLDVLDHEVDLLGGEVQLHGVSLLDVGMGVSDGSAIVGHDVRNLVLADSLLDDLAELEAGFFGVNSVWLESTLGVEKDSEVLVGLLDGDDIHVSEGESVISSDLSINLDETLFVTADSSAFIS